MKNITVLIFILLAAKSSCIAGNVSLTTSPPSVVDNSYIHYVPIGKTQANSPGVAFMLNATPIKGIVTDWHWDLINGTPASSTSQSPTIVWSGTNGYGLSNKCTATFDHFSSGVLCSSPMLTSFVNIIKPQLQFNTSGTFSPDDTLSSSSFGFATPVAFGSAQSYTSGFGIKMGGVPYEYKVTANPSNSGALADDFAIKEENVNKSQSIRVK